MAVWKRRVCQACGKQHQDNNVPRALEVKPPPCKKCGGATKYSEMWYVSLSLNGEPYVKAVSIKKKEAEEHEASLKTARANGENLGGVKPLPFPEATKIFLRWVDDRERLSMISSGTADSYRRRAEHHLEPFFRGYDIKQIDYDAADSYRDMRIEAGAAYSTINKEICILQRIISVCLQKKKIRFNPLSGYEGLPEDGRRTRFLSKPEISQLLEKCQEECRPPHLYPMVMVALETGLRRDGVMGLQWEHISFENNEIKRTVKGGVKVSIPMTSRLRGVLQAWRASQRVVGLSGYVFPSPNDRTKPLCQHTRFGYDTVCRDLGFTDVTFHTLRHTFATHFISATKDIHLLAKILGHSTTYITEIYAHVIEESKQQGIALFEAAMAQ